MADGYSVAVAGADERTAENVKACLGILDQGKAVDIRVAARELPVATAVALVRRGDAIVGVGAIKRARRPYARDKAAASGVPFDENTPELGYIAVATNSTRVKVCRTRLPAHSWRRIAARCSRRPTASA